MKLLFTPHWCLAFATGAKLFLFLVIQILDRSVKILFWHPCGGEFLWNYCDRLVSVPFKVVNQVPRSSINHMVCHYFVRTGRVLVPVEGRLLGQGRALRKPYFYFVPNTVLFQTFSFEVGGITAISCNSGYNGPDGAGQCYFGRENNRPGRHRFLGQVSNALLKIALFVPEENAVQVGRRCSNQGKVEFPISSIVDFCILVVFPFVIATYIMYYHRRLTSLRLYSWPIMLSMLLPVGQL